MQENICCICLDTIKKNENPYECNHLVHKKCAKQWNKSCPLCKSEMKFNNKNKKYIFEIGTTHGFNINVNTYLKLWNKNKCNNINNNNHIVKLNKPFGIVGYCSCGSIQSFNYISV